MNSRGAPGEDAAAVFLQSIGYRLLERNYRCRHGEIDIVAEQDKTLCFVEVKSRSSLAFGPPSESVGRSKQRHIIRTAQHYLQTHYGSRPPACRFDVVTLLPDTPPELIPDAFRVEY